MINVERLRRGIRMQGFQKLAYAVLHQDAAYAPKDESSVEAIKALGVKIAQMRQQSRIIEDGIVAFREVKV